MSRQPFVDPPASGEVVLHNSATSRLLSKQASQGTEESEEEEDEQESSASSNGSDDDALRKLWSDSSPREDVSEPAGETVRKIELATDCFALVLVGEVLCSPTKLLLLSLVCAACQVTVLLFMATFNEYAFLEGEWLTPRCTEASLMTMRFITLILSLLKASGELANALALFQAITSCRPPLRHNGRQKRSIRWAAWVAGIAQYIIAMCMLVTCAHISLAETNPMFSLIKVLAAWLVIDIDNILAVYAVEVFDWRHLDWSVQVSIDMEAKILPDTSGQAMRRSSWNLWSCKRASSARVERGRVLLKRASCARFIFFGVPVFTMFAEVGLALWFDVLPFTYLSRGYVTNVHPPLLLSSNVGLPAGCCPPKAKKLKDGFGWNVSLMFLLPAENNNLALARPPEISWVLLESMAIAPSSLQVVDGFTGKGLRLKEHFHGRTSAVRIQAHFWLLANDYGSGDAESIYKMLRNSPGLQLHRAYIPYSANFTVTLPRRSSQASYRIFVSAQNMQSLALAPEPVVSAPLHVAAVECGSGCIKCRQGHCYDCVEGKYLHHVRYGDDGACVDCRSNCKHCDKAENHTCNEHACSLGYGRTDDGLCADCNITGCSYCDRHLRATRTADNKLVQTSPGICDHCEPGRGLNGDRKRCDTCGHKCKSCNFSAGSASSNCSVCDSGYGLKSSYLNSVYTCSLCPKHCTKCSYADRCDQCAPGFGHTRLGCEKCAEGCRNCTTGGSQSCDSDGCRDGYGYHVEGGCKTCQIHKCVTCNFTGLKEHCSKCSVGYGTTPEDKCEHCGEFCSRCDRAGACSACQQKFTVDNASLRAGAGKCRACGDWCMSCKTAGPAHCDHCMQGFEVDKASRTCVPKDEFPYNMET